jgi:hypothetical protein
MNRMFLLTSVLALGVIVSSNVGAEDKDKDEKGPTIKEVMKTAHGEGGAKAKYTKAVTAEDWDDAKAAAKDWVKQAAALSKNKPTRGTAASWKKLTAAYEKNVKAAAAAADKKDAEGAKAALAKLGPKSCGGCHGPHKPPKKDS